MGLSIGLQVWKTPALTKTGWRSPASASRRGSTSDSALSPRRTADEVAAEVRFCVRQIRLQVAGKGIAVVWASCGGQPLDSDACACARHRLSLCATCLRLATVFPVCCRTQPSLSPSSQARKPHGNDTLDFLSSLPQEDPPRRCCWAASPCCSTCFRFKLVACTSSLTWACWC